MGSWNETCMLTHLPILEGEACVGFLVNATGVLGRTTYADKRYRPMSPPLFGVYDSYGRLEKVQEQQRLIEVLLSKGSTLSVKNEDEEEESISSIETLLTLVSKGRVHYKCSWQTASEVSLVLIKQRFYNLALQYAGTNVRRVRQLQRRLFPQRLGSPTALFNSDNFELKDDWKLMMSQSALPHPLLIHFARHGFDLSGVAAVNDFLEATRMHWTPTSGAGNAGGVDPIMVEFLNATLKEAKAQLHEMDELS